MCLIIIAASTVQLIIPCHRSKGWFEILCGVLLTVSYYHMTFMAIFRCHAIKCPVEHANMKRKKFFTGLVLVWVIPVLTLFAIAVYKVFVASTIADYLTILILTLVFSSILPYSATVVSALYLQFLWRNRRRPSSTRDTDATRKQNEENAKMTKTICGIIL